MVVSWHYMLIFLMCILHSSLMRCFACGCLLCVCWACCFCCFVCFLFVFVCVWCVFVVVVMCLLLLFKKNQLLNTNTNKHKHTPTTSTTTRNTSGRTVTLHQLFVCESYITFVVGLCLWRVIVCFVSVAFRVVLCLRFSCAWFVLCLRCWFVFVVSLFVDVVCFVFCDYCGFVFGVLLLLLRCVCMVCWFSACCLSDNKQNRNTTYPHKKQTIKSTGNNLYAKHVWPYLGITWFSFWCASYISVLFVGLRALVCYVCVECIVLLSCSFWCVFGVFFVIVVVMCLLLFL